MRKRKRELLSSFYKELADEMPKKREETEKLFQNLSVKNSLKIVQNMASDRTEQEFDNFMQYINQLSDTYNDFENKIMPN
jgi:DNA-dependent RNA polymerase auxiliary subunit epsilon